MGQIYMDTKYLTSQSNDSDNLNARLLYTNDCLAKISSKVNIWESSTFRSVGKAYSMTLALLPVDALSKSWWADGMGQTVASS